MSIFNIFKGKKKTWPEDGAIYAVTAGIYKGQMLVFVENNIDTYGAIAFPEMDIYNIPSKDVKDGIEKGIISYVECLPKDVFSICCAEYDHRKNLKNLKAEAKEDPVQDLIENDMDKNIKGEYRKNKDKEFI